VAEHGTAGRRTGKPSRSDLDGRSDGRAAGTHYWVTSSRVSSTHKFSASYSTRLHQLYANPFAPFRSYHEHFATTVPNRPACVMSAQLYHQYSQGMVAVRSQADGKVGAGQETECKKYKVISDGAAGPRRRTNSPLVTMGRTTFAHKITPFRRPIPKPNYLPHPLTHPIDHPKPHPYPISRFAAMHLTDRHRDQQITGGNFR